MYNGKQVCDDCLARKYEALVESHAELEDDFLRLASEVERLERVASQIPFYEEQICELRKKLKTLDHENHEASMRELNSMKLNHVEVQRTLSAVAAEKADLQAQLRQLVERFQALESEATKSNYMETQRADSATYLQFALGVAKSENLAQSKEIAKLRAENETLKREASVSISQQVYESLAFGSEISLTEGEIEAEDLQHKMQIVRKQVATNFAWKSEIATLRQQVKNLQILERNSLDQIHTLKKEKAALRKEADEVQTLRKEKAALQKEAEEIPALKASSAKLYWKLVQAKSYWRDEHKKPIFATAQATISTPFPTDQKSVQA